MKTISKNRFIRLTVLTIFLIAVGSQDAFTQNFFIVVAKVYKQQKCGSASFSNARGYEVKKELVTSNLPS